MLDVGVQVLHRMCVRTRRHSSCAHQSRIDLATGGRDAHLMCEVLGHSRLRAGLAGIMSHAWSHVVARGDTRVLHATRMWEVLGHLMDACHHLRLPTPWISIVKRSSQRRMRLPQGNGDGSWLGKR